MTTRIDPTLEVRQDRRLIRPNAHSKRFLLVRVEAPRATSERDRPPVNLAIVLDRSGSMSGPKLHVAKAAVEEAIGRLKPDDRFSVVVYDDVVDVVCAIDAGLGRGATRRHRASARGGRARQHEPRRRLAARLRTGRRPSCGERGQPLPAPDRRSRQCRDHRAGPAGDACPGASRARRLDIDLRRRQRLRRAAPAGPRRRRRRPFLLHRRRAADPRRDHVRGGRDARDGRPRGHPRDHRSRRHPDRRHQPVSADDERQPDVRVARRPGLRAGRRGRPAAVVPVRRRRPRDRGDRRPDRPRRRVRPRRRPGARIRSA